MGGSIPPVESEGAGACAHYYKVYLNLKIMTQFDMSTTIKKLQGLSRNRRFLISQAEKISRLLLFSQAANVESNDINT